MLDLACGNGRHLHWLCQQGFSVLGVDKTIAAARINAPKAILIEADLEQGPWPLRSPDGLQAFDAVVVTNYLWRPLFSTILGSLAPQGVLIYETFSVGNATVGRPSRPEYLLHSGELLQVCANLQIVGYECGFLRAPERFIQRIVAVNTAPCADPSSTVARYAL